MVDEVPKVGDLYRSRCGYYLVKSVYEDEERVGFLKFSENENLRITRPLPYSFIDRETIHPLDYIGNVETIKIEDEVFFIDD